MVTPPPTLAFFSPVRVAERDGQFVTDPGNWQRLRLLLEPFEHVRLVSIRTPHAGADWRPLPVDVVLVQDDVAPRFQPVTAGRRARLLAAMPGTLWRSWRHARAASAVGGVWMLQPVVLAGLAASRVLGRPYYGVGIGSTRDGFAVKAASTRGVRRRANRALAAAAGAVERSLARRSRVLLTAGDRLARAWGGGVPFSTSMLDAADLHARADTCTGAAITWAFSGGVSEAKGVDTLLEALALARRADPRHRAVLVGGVDPALGLDARLERLGLVGAVEATGRLPRAEVLARLRAADVYVFLSLHEGLPKAPLEAMAQSLPVVVTPTGAEQHVTDGASGVVVPVGDARAVAEAVARIASDGAFRRSLIANGFRAATSRTYDAARADVAAVVRRAFPDLARTSPSPWS